MFLKKINKNISISIFTLMLANTTIPTIHALGENKEINLTLSFQEEQSESIKNFDNIEEYIKKLYGNEDKFINAYNYENTYSEINPAKGILRINNIDNNGEITKIYEINIYESSKEIVSDIKQNNENEIESRKAIVYKKQMTGSPIDKYSLAVFSHGNYKSHFRIQIGNKNGTLKNYYKNNSWETGNTAKFKKSLIAAQNNVSSIKKKIGTGALFAASMAAVNKYLIGSGQIDKATIITILGTVGVTAVTAAAVGQDVVSYLINARNCGSYYNAIIKNS